MALKTLCFLSFIFLILCCQSESKVLPPVPNILFIMSDDHAEAAISSYGSQLIQTPNIDQLAQNGTLFTNSFVTNSICAPSRAVMLTGKFSHINGLRTNADRFDSSQVTFPKLLQEAGYYTALVGKWHLKSPPSGFDYWNRVRNQGFYYNPSMIEMGDTVKYTGYSTDIFTDLAIKALENRDNSKPFCLLVQHKAPHRNWMPHPRHLAQFANKKIPLPKTFHDDYQGRSKALKNQDMQIEDMYFSFDTKLMPEDYGKETGTGGKQGYTAEKSWLGIYNAMTEEQQQAWDRYYDPIRKDFRENRPEGQALAEWKYQRYMEDYLACVAAIDEGIGKLMAYLKENGLQENTIVIYTSDQGFYLGEHGWFDKRFMYEPSLRTPLIISYPKLEDRNTTSNALVQNIDLAPTILDFASVNIPPNMQGKSLLPLLQGKTPKNWRQAIYYHYYQNTGWHQVAKHYGIRTHRYKLLHYYDQYNDWELYDLEQDSTEINNLYNNPTYTEIQKELHVELDQLRAQYKVVD